MTKTILITGASSGIGKALARMYAKKNYFLILNGRNAEGLKEFENRQNILVVTGDVTARETLEKLRRSIMSHPVDVLVNNAGITFIQPFEENTEEQLNAIVETNLKTHIRITQMVYPEMAKRKSGTIVFMNSSAGRMGYLNHTMYCATKFGLKGFADSFRLEAKKNGIRVISVFPGGVKTKLYRNEPEVDSSAYMDVGKLTEIVFFLSETEGVSPDEIVVNRMSK